MTFVVALAMGVFTGLRAFTPLAVASWGARLGLVAPPAWLSFLAASWTPWVLTFLAIGELITDQLPSAPSRKVPVQFGIRIIAGALCGAALTADMWWLGAAAGATGGVIGTVGGASARARLAAAFRRDLPAALLEDAVAVAGAVLVVAAA